MASHALSLDDFDALGESIADALVLVSDDGTIAYANRVAERLFARYDGLVGVDFGFPVHVGQAIDIEVLAAGEAKVAEMRSAAITLAGVDYRVVTLRDVTVRNRSERQLREALHLREEVIALAAHELRTPLTVVAGLSHTLRDMWDDIDDDERRHVVDRIVDRSAELVSFVQRVLDRDHLDGWRADPGDELLERLVERALEGWPEVAIEVDVGDIRVWADGGQVIEILSNLVGNAVKYGEPPILVTGISDGRSAEIRVSDRGPGISPSMRDEIFEMGVRADERPDIDGSGLGLGIVRKLAQANGGAVRLEAGNGVGATFVVRLPARRPSAG